MQMPISDTEVSRDEADHVLRGGSQKLAKVLMRVLTDLEKLVIWSHDKGVYLRSPAHYYLTNRSVRRAHRLDIGSVYAVRVVDVPVDPEADYSVTIITIEFRGSAKSLNAAVEEYEGLGLSFIRIGQGGESLVYEYPPVSTESMLFYFLNPQVERAVEEHHRLEDGRAEMWKMVYRTTMEHPPMRRVPIKRDDFYFDDVVILDLSDHPSLFKFRELKQDCTNNLYQLNVFEPDLKAVNTYEVFDYRELAEIIEKELPEEILQLMDIAKRIHNAILRVPIAIAGLLAADEEWFSTSWWLPQSQ